MPRSFTAPAHALAAECGARSGRAIRQIAKVVARGPATLALLAIRSYQIALSPLFAGACRFHPSCSHYAAEAIRHHGLIRGGYFAARRLARCQPYGGEGFDPVPPASARVR